MKKSRPAPNASAGQTEDPWPPNPARGLRALVSSRGRETVACARESPEAGTLQPAPAVNRPACVRSVSQQACAERLLCARPVLAAGATVGADAGSCGTQGGETQPSKPGARCCTPHTRMWTGPARPSRACAPGSSRRPWPPTPTYLPSPGRGNSDPSLVPTSSRFSPPSDAECNPCIFSDWSKKEKKKKLLYKTCLHEPWEGLLHKMLRGAVPWWGHCQPWAPQAVAFCLRNPRTSTELGMWHTRPASPG